MSVSVVSQKKRGSFPLSEIKGFMTCTWFLPPHFLHPSSLSHLLTSSSSALYWIFHIPRTVFLLRFPFNPPTLCATTFSPSKSYAGWPNCSSPGGFLRPARAPWSHLPTEACWVLAYLGWGSSLLCIPFLPHTHFPITMSIHISIKKKNQLHSQ